MTPRQIHDDDLREIQEIRDRLEALAAQLRRYCHKRTHLPPILTGVLDGLDDVRTELRLWVDLLPQVKVEEAPA